MDQISLLLPPSLSLSSFIGMYNNTVLPTFHHLPDYSTASDNTPGVRCESKDSGPGSEADTLRGPIDSLAETHPPDQVSQTPNALTESPDWGNISAWMPGVINPPSQEVPGGTGMFGAVLTTYPTYSGSHFDRGLLAAHDSVRQTAGRSALPYHLGQLANTGADNGSSGLLEGMECQPVSEMTHAGRSPSGPSSASSDHDGLSSWSGPDHIVPSISDHHDRVSFGLFSNSLESVSSRRSIESTPDLELRSGDGVLIVIPEPCPAPVSPLPLPASSNWRRIPQRMYTPRKRDRSFLRLQGIAFSVNNIRGFNIRNALGNFFTGLDGRDDPVLEDANGPVSCRLLFPGYPANTRSGQIAVKNWKKQPAPITRSKLAYEIAKRVKQYLDTLATAPIDPSVDARWTIGQGCMKLEKMYLVSVSWVSQGSLQPEIWVDDS